MVSVRKVADLSVLPRQPSVRAWPRGCLLSGCKGTDMLWYGQKKRVAIGGCLPMTTVVLSDEDILAALRGRPRDLTRISSRGRDDILVGSCML